MYNNNLKRVIIWDLDDAIPQFFSGDLLILWNNLDAPRESNYISINSYIEQNADRLKNKYLNFVHDISSHKYLNKNIFEYFEIKKGYSYFWMTDLIEKSNISKSPDIHDVIKFFALEEILLCVTGSYTISVYSHNYNLIKAYKRNCKIKNIHIVASYVKKRPLEFSIKLCFDLLPNSFKAVFFLIHFIKKNINIFNFQLNEWKNSNGEFTFIDYLSFDNLKSDKNLLKKNKYWGNLPYKLVTNGIKINWLHLFVKQENLTFPRELKSLINKYQHNSKENNLNTSLSVFFSFDILFLTLIDWLRLIIIHFRFTKLIRKKINEKYPLWGFYEKDWNQNFFGVVAIQNLLHLNLFIKAFKLLPKQKYGIYLQENQAWENALIYAWRVNNHGFLIGYAHATIRYWDLRYFFDNKTHNFITDMPKPIPDLFALNGLNAIEIFQKNGIPQDKIVSVEALRYLYLNNNPDYLENNRNNNLLVLGDYDINTTRRQLNLLNQIIFLIDSSITITFKPHFTCPIEKLGFINSRIQVTNKPLNLILKNFNTAFVGSSTSSILDAYYSRLNIIVLLPFKDFNFCPLYGKNDIQFVSTKEHLLTLVNSKKTNVFVDRNVNDFFFLNSDLSKWGTLLKLAY